jgi:hypothetical protein
MADQAEVLDLLDDLSLDESEGDLSASAIEHSGLPTKGRDITP